MLSNTTLESVPIATALIKPAVLLPGTGSDDDGLGFVWIGRQAVSANHLNCFEVLELLCSLESI